MLLLAGAGLGLLAGLLSGGRLRHLSFPRLHLRWPLLPFLALGVREFGVYGPLSEAGFQPVLYLVSLLALLGWALWHLWELRGVWLVALGLALNLAVVAANGGHMPVSPALAVHGPPRLLELGVFGQYALAGPDTRLGWLGDWIRLPDPVSRLFPEIYSAGDLLVSAGMMVVTFWATRLKVSSRR
jgi:hypothetical protein